MLFNNPLTLAARCCRNRSAFADRRSHARRDASRRFSTTARCRWRRTCAQPRPPGWPIWRTSAAPPPTRSRPTSATCASSSPGCKADLGHAPCLADLARLDAKRFRAFMAARRRAGFAGRSLARTMSALRAFFRWLEAQEIASNRGVLQVAMPKVPHGIPKPLTVEKAAAVVDGGAAAELDWVAARDTAVLLLLYGSRPAHLRGARADAQGRAAARPRRPAHRRQGRQGAAGAGAARHAGGRSPATSRSAPTRSTPRRPAVPRRQGRPPEPAHRPAADGAPARRARACPPRRRRTRCATPLPRICSRPAPICGRSRSCWATPACRPRRSTPRSTARACSPSTTRPIRALEVIPGLVAGIRPRRSRSRAYRCWHTGVKPLTTRFHSGDRTHGQNPPSSSAPAPASAPRSPARCSATATGSRSRPATRTSSPPSPRRPARSSSPPTPPRPTPSRPCSPRSTARSGPLDVVALQSQLSHPRAVPRPRPEGGGAGARGHGLSAASSSARRRRDAWLPRARARSSSPAPRPA